MTCVVPPAKLQLSAVGAAGDDAAHEPERQRTQRIELGNDECDGAADGAGRFAGKEIADIGAAGDEPVELQERHCGDADQKPALDGGGLQGTLVGEAHAGADDGTDGAIGNQHGEMEAWPGDGQQPRLRPRRGEEKAAADRIGGRGDGDGYQRAGQLLRGSAGGEEEP